MTRASRPSPRDAIAGAVSTTDAWADLALDGLHDAGYVVVPREPLVAIMDYFRELRRCAVDLFGAEFSAVREAMTAQREKPSHPSAGDPS